MENRCKILVTEQNGTARAQLVSRFQQMDDFLVVGSTGNGEEAMQLLSQERPDILILDMLLPKCDGLQILAHLKTQPVSPRVIAVSALLTDYLVRSAMALNIAHILIKPYDPESLIQAVIDLRQAPEAPLLMPPYQLQQLQIITGMIQELGIPAHVKGYAYLREAIFQAARNPALVNAVTKALYPQVARTFHVTASQVERAIRHAITLACCRGDPAVIQRFFGLSINFSKGRPTNSEFIALLADQVRLCMQNNIVM